MTAQYLVERAKQPNDHVEANALGNKHHSTYKAWHSTETVLLSIQIDMRLALPKGGVPAVVHPHTFLNRLSS